MCPPTEMCPCYRDVFVTRRGVLIYLWWRDVSSFQRRVLVTYVCLHYKSFLIVRTDPHYKGVSSLQRCVLIIEVCPHYKSVSSLYRCVLLMEVCHGGVSSL